MSNAGYTARVRNVKLRTRWVGSIDAAAASDSLLPLWWRVVWGGFLVVVLAVVPVGVSAQVLGESVVFKGRFGYAVTGGTLRAESDLGNRCAVLRSGSEVLGGLPSGATVERAFLYWVGSGGVADNNVRLNGVSVVANRTFADAVAPFGGEPTETFGAVANVSSLVGGNGTYTFSGLTVKTDGSACDNRTVVAGWVLIVVYKLATMAVGEIRIADGLWSTYDFTAYGVVSPEDRKKSEVTFNGLNVGQGDDVRVTAVAFLGQASNSAGAESVKFNGSVLTDALNPVNDPFNSTINTIGRSDTWAVDADTYPVGAYVPAGGLSAVTVAGAASLDFIVMNVFVLGVQSKPRVEIGKTAVGGGQNVPGMDVSYVITLANAGDTPASAVAVIDELPISLALKIGSVQQSSGVTATVSYSSNGGATFGYVPVSGGCGAAAGYDGCVNRVRWVLDGSVAGRGSQQVDLTLTTRIR